MANFTGFVLSGFVGTAITSDTDLRQSFYNNIDFATSGSATLASTVLAGAITSNSPLQVRNNHTGFKLEAYAAIFYNRIIISPSPLDVGNVVTDKSFELSVFNAFFTESNLTAINEINLGGITIGAPAAPTTFSPLQEIVYTITVSVGEGPPTIAGAYQFDFEGTDRDQIVNVVGARVLALPYLFQAGLTESLTFKTKVLTANDGGEQRMKLRNAPRQGYNFNIAVPRNQIQQLDSLLYGWRANFFGLPISSECRDLISDTSASSPNIDVNTDFADFRVGGLAMIYESPTSFEIVSIISFTSNQIITNANITKVYGEAAVVMPMQVARLLGAPVRSTTGDRQRVAANFQVTDNIVLSTVASAVQYKGLDVYLEQPLTVGLYATDTYDTRVDVIDYGTGALDVFAPWVKPKVKREFGLQFESQEDVWNYRLWLHRREGKLRPFWMPTFETNFTLVSEGALVTQFEVLDEGQLGLTTERNDIAILTTTGWLLRGIVSIAQFGDNLLITVDSNIGVNATEVELLSFLGRKRLTSDRLEITWGGNNTGSAVVPITEINN